MTCKNCGKELEPEESICSRCGQDNSSETMVEKQRINPWKIAFPATVSFGLLLVLCWLLYFGVTGYWLPKANNIYNQDSYTASADQLNGVRQTVVATLGKNKLTNGQLQMFYYSACLENKDAYSAKTPLDQQIYNEKTKLTWQQYLLELSLNTWKQYRILTDMALEAGFQLPAEYQKILDNMQKDLEESAKAGGYASADAMLSDRLCQGCTVADYKYYVELSYYASLYFEKLSSEIELSQDEINDYYEKYEDTLASYGYSKDSGMIVDFRDIFVKAGSNVNAITQKEWDDCKEKAEGILNQWLENDPSEESFSALATEKSDDAKTKPYGGLNSSVRKSYLTRVDVRHILIKPEGGTKSEDGKTTVYTEEAWEECRKKAQAVLDEYLNGGLTEEEFSELAKKHSADGNAAQGGIYTDVTKGMMVAEFDAWIFDETRKPGDTGLVKTQFGYHVMYYVRRDSELNDWLFDDQNEDGAYGLVKADDGYHVVFISHKEAAWIQACRDLLLGEKKDALLSAIVEEQTLNIKYGRICLSQ